MGETSEERPIIFPSSSIPRESREEAVKKARLRLKERAQQGTELFSKVEIDLSERSEYQRIIDFSKDDLRILYLSAGQTIKESDFPRIHLFPSDMLTEDASLGRSISPGRYDVKSHDIIAFVSGGEELLDDVWTIHHEFHHSIGKRILTVKDEVIQVAQHGHITKGKETRGEILEEGVTAYFAIMFALHSKDPIVSNAREQFAELAKKSLPSETLEDIDGIDADKEKRLCWAGLASKLPDQIIEAYYLVYEIMEAAGRAYPDDRSAKLMREDLLGSRIDPKLKRSLFKRIDGIFGTGTSKEILRLKFDKPDEVRRFRKELRKRIA